MTMKRTFGILFALALFVFASAAMSYAQIKVGVINSQDVLEKSGEGKKVLARLTETDKQNQATIAKLDDEIRQIQTKLNTQAITLTEDAVTQLRADLDRKNTDRKRKAEDAYSGMQDLTQRLFAKVQQELIPIVEQIGKERAIDIILDAKNSGAVYWSPAIDLTADVIKRYDAAKAAGK
jgi:Skp family chaperone for outer membrane proteins